MFNSHMIDQIFQLKGRAKKEFAQNAKTYVENQQAMPQITIVFGLAYFQNQMNLKNIDFMSLLYGLHDNLENDAQSIENDYDNKASKTAGKSIRKGIKKMKKQGADSETLLEAKTKRIYALSMVQQNTVQAHQELVNLSLEIDEAFEQELEGETLNAYQDMKQAIENKVAEIQSNFQEHYENRTYNHTDTANISAFSNFFQHFQKEVGENNFNKTHQKVMDNFHDIDTDDVGEIAEKIADEFGDFNAIEILVKNEQSKEIKKFLNKQEWLEIYKYGLMQMEYMFFSAMNRAYTAMVISSVLSGFCESESN